MWASWRLQSPAIRLFDHRVYPDYYQRKSRAPHHWPFVREIHDRRIPLIKGKWCGNRFHVMTSSWKWKICPNHWPFVKGIHRSPPLKTVVCHTVNVVTSGTTSCQKDKLWCCQWRQSCHLLVVLFPFMLPWRRGWTNSRVVTLEGLAFMWRHFQFMNDTYARIQTCIAYAVYNAAYHDDVI